MATRAGAAASLVLLLLAAAVVDAGAGRKDRVEDSDGVEGRETRTCTYESMQGVQVWQHAAWAYVPLYQLHNVMRAPEPCIHAHDGAVCKEVWLEAQLLSHVLHVCPHSGGDAVHMRL